MSIPLEGVRIVEIGQYVAAPGATAIMAALGADIIKVEPIAGEAARHIGPSSAAVVQSYNRGKRSVAVDLTDARCSAAVRRVAVGADALVQNLRPGSVGRLGLDAATLRAAHPGLVYVSLRGYGADGPGRERPGLDVAAQAESGMMSLTGDPDGPPQRIGFPVVDAAATHVLAEAMLAALVRRMRTGEGAEIELSLLDIALQLQAVPFMEYATSGEMPTRTGSGQPTAAPASDLVATADGHVVVSAYRDAHWRRLAAAIERPGLADDPRFRDNSARVRHRTELRAELADALSGHTTEECVARLGAAGIVVGAVRDHRQVLAAEDVRRSPVVHIGPDGGRRLDLPYRFADGLPDTGPVPAAGAHTREVLTTLGGLTDDEVGALVRDGVARVA